MEWIATGLVGIIFEILDRHKREAERPSLGEAFSDLRRICAEEGYELAIPPRQDRPNPFVGTDDVSL
ncbi:MAG TPA: hypothetical protein VLE27_11350 [Thermoanaerobaculia bacterium]|nr:hypothetical protein [Thermoanaerobaculia bacterium]